MRILLAYDGLEHSRHALEQTAKLAADGKAEITVFSVVPPDARGSKSGGTSCFGPTHTRTWQAHAYLRELGLPSEMKMDAGDPAEQIVAEATTGSYDVVVVGSRGHGALGRLFLGSVSTEVVARAPCGPGLRLERVLASACAEEPRLSTAERRTPTRAPTRREVTPAMRGLRVDRPTSAHARG